MADEVAADAAAKAAAKERERVRKVIQESTGMKLNEDQFMAAMAAEHCNVAPGDPESADFGASNRPFTTGNYALTTTPAAELRSCAALP